MLEDQVDFGLFVVNYHFMQFGYILMLHFFEDGYFIAYKHAGQRLFLRGFFFVFFIVRGRTVYQLTVLLKKQLLLYVFALKDLDSVGLVALALGIHSQIDISKGALPQ